jgi:hypothetical protein
MNGCSSYHDQSLDKQVSWCPTVPGTCLGWSFDWCTRPADMPSPMAKGACTADVLLPACGNLVEVSKTGSVWGYAMQIGSSSPCPKELYPSGKCLLEASKV